MVIILTGKTTINIFNDRYSNLSIFIIFKVTLNLSLYKATVCGKMKNSEGRLAVSFLS